MRSTQTGHCSTRITRGCLIVTLATLPLTSCNQSATPANSSNAAANTSMPSEAVGAPTDAPVAAARSWKVTRSADPITDVTMYTARATLTGAEFDAQAQITCGGDRIGYTLDVFRKDGSPAPMLVRYRHIAGQYRLDKQPPRAMSQLPTGLANQYYWFVLDPAMARADTLLVRMELVDNTGTFAIDQGSPPLRPMLEQCASIMQARSNNAQAQEDAYQRDKRARCGDHPCPIILPEEMRSSRPPTTPSMSEADLARVGRCQEGPADDMDRDECAALLSRYARFEDAVARRDVELEAE